MCVESTRDSRSRSVLIHTRELELGYRCTQQCSEFGATRRQRVQRVPVGHLGRFVRARQARRGGAQELSIGRSCPLRGHQVSRTPVTIYTSLPEVAVKREAALRAEPSDARSPRARVARSSAAMMSTHIAI